MVLIVSGVTKGSTVAIYLPMIPEILVAMLACARIGAPHSIVVCSRSHVVHSAIQFGGFSAEALADRLIDCQARVLITAGM